MPILYVVLTKYDLGFLQYKILLTEIWQSNRKQNKTKQKKNKQQATTMQAQIIL